MKWLTTGGVVAAIAVGCATGWGLGWRGVVLLFAFFISGSLLTRLAGGSGGQRTYRQVLANGGVAALAALLGSWPIAAGALAAATADTWATEIGSFSPRAPRLITTWQPVTKGTDGGVTLLGTAGGISGALFIAGSAALLFAPAMAVVWAGVAGMFVDSALGATIQGKFLDNDGVNFAATVSGAGTAYLLTHL
ncbi:MAG TPA: DUF92 domain-containing protein [Gemmatimonadales bacterium]|nr:DUF92 domain-containing protein [Gemmatimonadales bacterium]